jgi:hypothetical protein
LDGKAARFAAHGGTGIKGRKLRFERS